MRAHSYRLSVAGAWFGKRGAVPAAVAVAAALAMAAVGWIEPLEHRLMELRFWLTQRPATGDMVVVGLDNKSIEALGVWPWPRERHAALIDHLNAAGARGIAFDIDFSSASTPAGDAALAAALARANPPVVLPVFQQYASLERRDDEIHHTGPLPLFESHSRLASVNLRPGGDGLVRQYSLTQSATDNMYLSMGAAFATVQQPSSDGFYLDFGIRPETIPYVSFGDVLDGKVDPAQLRDKFVLVGATAIELGDNVPAPIYRALPGVTLQALAYESIVQGRMLLRSSSSVTWIVALVLAVLAGARFSRWQWRRGLLVLAGASAALSAVSYGLQALLPVSLDIVAWIIVLSAAYLAALMQGSDRLASRIFQKGMALLNRGATMRAMFDDSFDGIVIVDEAGRIEQANPAAGQLLGCESRSLIGSPARELFRELGPQGELTHTTLETDLRRHDGTALAVELVIRRSPLGRSRPRLEQHLRQRQISVWTFRDISERKRAADAQKAALQQAVAASRAKSEFIANMGHELRTPLNAIIGFSEMLKSQVLGPIGKADYLSYASGIHSSGLRLLESVNSILDYARIEGSRYELEMAPVALGDTIEAAIAAVAEAAKQKGIQIENRCPAISLKADGRAIRQILGNLLSNAVKFTGDNGRVVVSAIVDGKGDCLLAVADDGIGMTREQLEKVLKPFQQADGGLARKYEGVGLGLSVAAGLMQLHDGALMIDSAANDGTTVTLRFPAVRVLNGPAASLAIPPEDDAAARPAGATIHKLKPRAAAAPRS
ncbi:MAG TPA: CHASE2 domain-containing protein [Dongiaceae bacterium]